MQGKRTHRLGGQIQQEVSDIISRKVKDPRMGFITVTGVDMSSDLRYATVYISVLGEEGDLERNLKWLASAAGFIRHELGTRLHVKHTPELRFRSDDSTVKGMRIDSILKEIKESTDGEDLS